MRIAVSGTHGKTTITAMIAWLLTYLDQDPSYIVGGTVKSLGGRNAHAGKGPAFVIEADEYDNMFLGLKPQIEVVTSIEHDHPDFFPTFDSMLESFKKFVNLLPSDGTFIACTEDTGAMELVSYARKTGKNVVGYQIQGEATMNSPLWVMAREVKANQRGGFNFVASSNLGSTGLDSVEVSLQVPGVHNVRNALAVLAIGDVLGLPRQKMAKALAEFTGTGRRFQLRGEVNGISIFDDYAHHPSEITATLAAAKNLSRETQSYLIAVFQPHLYSRTQRADFDDRAEAGRKKGSRGTCGSGNLKTAFSAAAAARWSRSAVESSRLPKASRREGLRD